LATSTGLALLFGLILALTTASCGRYSANELELATAARAKEVCSCYFVANMQQQFLTNVVQQNCTGDSLAETAAVTVQVDLPNKIVEAQALLMWSARARFVSEQAGCVLE
jgi:hypothetical protein